IIHWYKQKEGKAPERLLFVSGSEVTFEHGFQANRYMAEGNSFLKQCVLTIKDVIPDDAATYYCAYWDPHYLVKALFTVIGYYNKVFGTGTRLVVSEKGSYPPANSEILQKKHENQTTYVCLIEKFYPDVIRVTWADDEKEVTENVVKGDTWQSTKEDEYSIASWLTVPAENEDKNYYCKYEHEDKKASLPTQDSVKTVSQEEDCRTGFNRGNLILFCLIFVTDQLMHRTAYLVYIILLLKSSMYYLIVLFFIYK
ncbi:IGK protein, partial [Buphagus erythrorhynchus]|nr:IGK protein [Buphagus erythrorhynchus]